MISRIKFIMFSAALFINLNISVQVQAKSHLQTLPADTQEDLALIKRVADNPNLLNQQYLDYYLGPKASAMIVPASQSMRSPKPVIRMFWLDRSKNSTRYSLEQSMPQPNKYLAELSFSFARQEDVILPDVNKTLKKDATHTMDENAQPTFKYSVSPYLNIFAYQDTRVANLSRITMQYAGPPLLPPSQADMAEAIKHRRDTAFTHAHHGQHDKASYLLKSHLAANPNDAEAHLKLAESYQASSCINDAIREYKTALSLTGNEKTDAAKEIHDRCIRGLHSLKVDLPTNTWQSPASLPPNYNAPGPRININQKSGNIPQFSPSSSLNSSSNSSAGQKIKPLDVGF